MAHITKNLTTYRIVLLMAILCCGCLNLSAQNVLTGSSNLFRDSDIDPVYTTIVSTSYANLQPVAFKKAAYRLSVDESQLLADDVNDSIKQVDSRAETEQETIDKDIFHYQVHQNGRMVSVDYILDEPATVTSLISDVMGIVYRRSTRNCSAGENSTITLDCTGLRHGHYVLYLNVNGKVYSGNVLVN